MESNIRAANLLKLMRMLEARLNNNRKVQMSFALAGETVETKVFSTEKQMVFLDISLAEFNQCPKFTNFSFDDSKFVEQFSAILVEGAVVIALSSQALLEKGREYATMDQGTTFDPPRVSDLLQEQYAQLYSSHWEKLKFIKEHIADFMK